MSSWGVPIDLEGDVRERRLRHRRTEQLLVLRVGELEERERTPIRQSEERVAVDPLGTEQLVGLAPRRNERQSDQVLVEATRRLLIAGHPGVVVQAGNCGLGHRFGHAHPPISPLRET
jgi:hypothetical protein